MISDRAECRPSYSKKLALLSNRAAILTPSPIREKGQVENQVGLVRERFFTPRLRFKSYDELNAWLMDKCIAWAKAHGHPERPDQTILILSTHTRCKSRNPYKARRTAAEFARWSAWSCPRRMSASISRSRNSMPRNRNPLRRRSRCRSIRAADDERGSAFVAGDSFTVPGS